MVSSQYSVIHPTQAQAIPTTLDLVLPDTIVLQVNNRIHLLNSIALLVTTAHWVLEIQYRVSLATTKMKSDKVNAKIAQQEGM